MFKGPEVGEAQHSEELKKPVNLKFSGLRGKEEMSRELSLLDA